jgi:hypothetical protein
LPDSQESVRVHILLPLFSFKATYLDEEIRR